MCSDTGTYHEVFSREKLCRQIYLPGTKDSYIYENIVVHTNSDSNILATVEKADRVDFLEEDCSTSTGKGFDED